MATDHAGTNKQPTDHPFIVTGNMECIQDEVHRLYRACVRFFSLTHPGDPDVQRATREAQEAYARTVEYFVYLEEAVAEWANDHDAQPAEDVTASVDDGSLSHAAEE